MILYEFLWEPQFFTKNSVFALNVISFLAAAEDKEIFDNIGK